MLGFATRTASKAFALFALLGIVGLVGTPSIGQPAKYVLRVSGSTTEEDVRYEAVKYLISHLPSATSGRVAVQAFYGTLGDEAQLLQRLKLGTLDAYIGSTGVLEGATGEGSASLYDIPFLFKDWDSLYKISQGPIGQNINQKVTAKGIRVLDYVSLGNRALYTRSKPIRTPADLAGLKIRVLPNPMYVALYKEYGAVPVAMPFSEVYTGLQTGALDGADGALGSGLASKHYEVSKYVTYLGNYLVIASIIAVSEQWWQSLPNDLRNQVSKVVHDASLYEHQKDEAQKKTLEQEWMSKGVQFTDVDRKQFALLARKIYPVAESKVGAQLVQAALKAQE